MKLKRILATAAFVIGTSVVSPAAFARVDFGISVGTAPPPLRVAPGPIGVAPGRATSGPTVIGIGTAEAGCGPAEIGYCRRTVITYGLRRTIIPTTATTTITAATGGKTIRRVLSS
jgi:hypothetical protein